MSFKINRRLAGGFEKQARARYLPDSFGCPSKSGKDQKILLRTLGTEPEELEMMPFDGEAGLGNQLFQDRKIAIAALHGL